MKISEVEKITGLTDKAIRYYEQVGLIRIPRYKNSYRNFTDEVIFELIELKKLRQLNISIQDIKLWKDGKIRKKDLISKQIDNFEILTKNAKELLDGKKLEIKRANVTNSVPNQQTDPIYTERSVSVGVDIGTDTISILVSDYVTGKVCYVKNISGNAIVPSENSWERLQSPDILYHKVKGLIDNVREIYHDIVSIGVTGQMHGIVYVDRNGNATSPLITWQDERGDRPFSKELTYVEYLKKKYNIRLSTGFGLVTHYYNVKNKAVPLAAEKICTVMDYICMKLSGNTVPIIHSSNAASLGFYDINNNCFMREVLNSCGISVSILPKVTDKSRIIGGYEGIPIAVAIGDNQASFYGAVQKDENAVLVNIGTGSQVTVITDKKETNGLDGNIELRPYIDGKMILAGSALCGGRAYALLERFFRAFAVADSNNDGEKYSVLNVLAEKAMDNHTRLKVNTQFQGTRDNPKHTGSIEGITTENFTPENLSLGVLYGIVEELGSMYRKMPQKSVVVASGNGVRKNPLMHKIIFDCFGKIPMVIEVSEEAAYGAALFATHCE